ncbi:4-(cytidine 5'-diphospho)-2-C-methyl-D-erythritol kinase, partial [Candidatus Ruminimicrobium bovinum]|uniref:4-(cytidine 5'-diphospho)-2-C-methyl-D-erythritol kinase n=1 Tax=Candidatus Ruminimicrobium bovinum TaxID=3242779 RepID=UPI0039B92C8D
MKMQVQAPAKINLYLEIIDKRPDGYHNLQSIMHTVSLFDTLCFENDISIKLTCSDENLPVDKTNLVYKTVVKMQQAFCIDKGIKIHLIKNIPTGAGLGGGSSDAAATIIALNKMWNLNKTKKELEIFAATIGADVPFFLTGGTAIVEG